MITGQDLVQWQLEVAAGNPLPLTQSEIPMSGHSFEARIYAENPRNNFLPDVGPLLHVSTPSTSTSVRLEEGFREGSNIEVYYDPLIAKLVVHGRDRTEALRFLRKALEEYHIVGVSTNVEFLRTLAGNGQFIAGNVETGFIQKYHGDLFPPRSEPNPETLAQAALHVALRDGPRAVPYSPWTSLGPLRFGGDTYERIITFKGEHSPPTNGDDAAAHSVVRVKFIRPEVYDIEVSNPANASKIFRSVAVSHLSSSALASTFDGRRLRSTIVSEKPPAASPTGEEKLHIFHEHSGERMTLVIPAPTWLQARSSELQAAQSQGGIRAPMPSLVVDVRVEIGQTVEAGQAVVILESMKTETVLRAAVAGTVNAINCKKGEMVEEGRELILIEAGVTADDN